MSPPLLAILRLLLLVLVYLFFLRVVRAVWVEIKAPVAVGTGGSTVGRAAAPSRRAASAPAKPRRAAVGTTLVVVEPPDRRGRIYDLGDMEVTIGRDDTSTITVEDTFVSQHHARVVRRDGEVTVHDDNSTNGTFVNGRRIRKPVVIRPGDQIQVGNAILELR